MSGVEVLFAVATAIEAGGVAVTSCKALYSVLQGESSDDRKQYIENVTLEVNKHRLCMKKVRLYCLFMCELQVSWPPCTPLN